ncbi:MAG: hypothetical protein ETSY1_00855 [Candidatus Entotheonella factor]|uniref:Uncharacterized protein n=1 Tax=Entotheonella factor TaxID=1429438 RepID=W4LZM9_ENTF1|nr:MAG: hypothetical protein ETSY1_00855 [Candidatus Entotheonella factor]
MYFVNQGTKFHILGLIAECQQSWQDASTAFEEAIHIEPENVSHWYALGRVAFTRGEADQSLYAFNMALDMNPLDPIALTFSYDALHALGHDTEALRRVACAVELDSANVPALRRLIEARIRMGWHHGKEGQKTWRLLGQAQRRAAGDPEVHECLAQYYMARGEWDKVPQLWQNFTIQYPCSPTGWQYAAKWHQATGDDLNARVAIQQAYHLQPDHPDIRKAMQVPAYG